MGERGAPLVGVGRQAEVDRRRRVQPVEAGHQALRVVCRRMGERVAGLDQWTGQVHLGSVDGERAMAFPPPIGAVVPKNLAVQIEEQVLVNLCAGLADRRGGHGRTLRQCDAELAALIPQLGEDDRIALVPARQNETEHEQHDDQAVEDPFALHPLAVVSGGELPGRIDDLHPHRDVRVVARWRRGLAARRRPALTLQHRAEAGVERKDKDLLRRLGPASASAPGRHADHGPVGGSVASPVETGRIHERLAQDRSASMALLPLLRKLTRCHGKGFGGEIVHPDPREDQEPAVRHRQMQPAVTVLLAPSDPRVAGGQRLRRRLEQQAAETSALPVQNKPAQVRAERARTAEAVVPVDQLVPVGDVPLLHHWLERQRLQFGQGAIDLRPGVGAPGVSDRRAGTGGRVPFLRQGQDPASLQTLQHAHAGRDPVTALRGGPVQVLADRLGEFVAAQGRAQRHRLLDVGDLAPGQATPAKCGGLESLDPRIHRPRSPLTVLPERKVPRAVRFVNPDSSAAPRAMEPAWNQRVGSHDKICGRNRRLTKCHWGSGARGCGRPACGRRSA